MVKDDCVFCKIAAGEIPSKTVYEDEKFRAILDISPASKGHAIILPKNHADNIYELPDEDASEIFVVAKKLAKGMKEALHCEGINVLQNNGELAGQTVFHLHVHVIPRYKEDKIVFSWQHGEPSDEELKSLAEAIKQSMK
jgi:histidine triad (HIT) family protein